MDIILSLLKQSVTITFFVLGMMLIIEYLNVFTHGLWSKGLKTSAWKQILTGTLLGLIPGCLGAYTAVSLYVHNVIGMGALVATMIATSGDEAFFMFSIIPTTALILHLIIFAIAIISGFAVHFFFQKKFRVDCPDKQFTIHQHELSACGCFDWPNIKRQLIKPSLLRFISLFVLFILFTFILLMHHHGHDAELIPIQGGQLHEHPEWIRLTFLAILVITIFIVATVNEHFLRDHLWKHVIRKHFPRVFLWTLGTLAAMTILNSYLDLENIIQDNLFIVLLIAVLVGIIPESGPHLVFVLLFAAGSIPFSILLASSIVQDGHGSIPLLAETRRGFLTVKAINILIGFIAGGAGLLLGF